MASVKEHAVGMTPVACAKQAAARPSACTWFGIGLALASLVMLAWTHGVLVGIGAADNVFWKFTYVVCGFVVAGVCVWHNPIGRRVFASFLYAIVMVIIMALAGSVAWYRNPNAAGFLPDIVHEFVPHVQNVLLLPGWLNPVTPGTPLLVDGLDLIEYLMAFVIIGTVIWALTQPARWLIFRRTFVIYGTLAVWRSMTILMTSLPDANPRCTYTTPGTVLFADIPWSRVLWRGLATFTGTLTDSCRTAGDMVFSGHTMVLVMCGMVWHAYYSERPGVYVVNPVKVAVWALTAAAVVLIILTRLHYTLDVILAIYFAVTLFNAYHRLADDVLVGHRFVAVWVLDGLLIYPAVQWLEAPHLGEARRIGMVSTAGETDLIANVTGMRRVAPMPEGAGSMPEDSDDVTPPPAAAIKPHDKAPRMRTPAAPAAARTGASRGASGATHAWPYCCPHHLAAASRAPDAFIHAESPCQPVFTLPRAIYNADGGFRARRRAQSTRAMEGADSDASGEASGSESVGATLRRVAAMLQRAARHVGLRDAEPHVPRDVTTDEEPAPAVAPARSPHVRDLSMDATGIARRGVGAATPVSSRDVTSPTSPRAVAVSRNGDPHDD